MTVSTQYCTSIPESLQLLCQTFQETGGGEGRRGEERRGEGRGGEERRGEGRGGEGRGGEGRGGEKRGGEGRREEERGGERRGGISKTWEWTCREISLVP